MNLEKIAALLGQLQTIVSVIDQLPPDCHKTVMGTLAANGLDVALIVRNAVKAKHSLQAIPNGNFEPLVAISTTHLPVSVREAIDAQMAADWSVVIYPNENGAFMAVVESFRPADTAPASIKDAYAWAVDRGIKWIKFDADAPQVSDLPCYGDGETQLSEDDVVLSA